MYTDPAEGRGLLELRSPTSVRCLTAILIVSVLAVSCFVLFDDSDESDAVTVGDFTYTLSVSDATVTGYTGTSSEITIPSSIHYGDDDYTVVAVGAEAFENCLLLESITIPGSVTTLGNGAFSGCRFLQTVNHSDSITFIGERAFEQCNSLKNFTMPNGLTTLGGCAFYECTSLTSVTIPNTLSHLNGDTFEFCTSLSSITLSNTLDMIQTEEFRGTALTTITIPASVTYVSSDAFEGCTSLTAINVEDGNTKYEDMAGVLINYDTATLLCYPPAKPGSSYTIPDTIGTISGWAFYQCVNLKSVTIPNTAVNRNEAFYECTSLESVTFGNSIATIYADEFNGCTNLKSVTLPSSVTSIGDRAFARCISLTSLTIPGNVTSIGEMAFAQSTGLTSITIPDSVTSLGEYPLLQCYSLTAVNVGGSNSNYSSSNGVLFNKSKSRLMIYPAAKSDSEYTVPNGVVSVDPYAFGWNTHLTTVTLGKDVSTLGESAFFGCTSLATLVAADANTHFDSDGGVLFNEGKTELVLYPIAKSDTAYTVPSTVTSIAALAFYGNTHIATVALHDGLTNIGANAFRECTSLTSVSIPAAVTSIGSYAFVGTASLTSFAVAEGNAKYAAEDGVLFNKSKSRLIQYPLAKSETSYTLPDTVTTIDNFAFHGNSALISLTAGTGNTAYSSKDGSIYDKEGGILLFVPPGLTTFTFPSGITVVEDGAVCSDCLKTVEFAPASKVVMTYAFIDCNVLKKIIVNDGSKPIFSEEAIGYSTLDKHTLFVIAPSGFSIPDLALGGNIEVVYGAPPLAVVTQAPAAVANLSYTGSAQALITAGTADGGTFEYSLDGNIWSTAIPTATESGAYTVYCRVVGDALHDDLAQTSVSASIAGSSDNPNKSEFPVLFVGIGAAVAIIALAGGAFVLLRKR